jgi:hypothetical protein
MEESRALERAGWAGAASVVLLVVGLTLCATAGVEDPGVSDAAILNRLDDGARQTAAGIGLPVLGAGLALLLWFASGLRRVLDRLSGGDPLAHVTVPAAALLGGLMITGVSLDVSSAIAALSDEFTPDADIARALGTAGGLIGVHRADRRRGAGRRDDADRPAGARPADVGRLGVLRRRRAVPVRLLGRGHGGCALLAMGNRRRRRGAARGATDTAGAGRPGAGRTGDG